MLLEDNDYARLYHNDYLHYIAMQYISAYFLCKT